MALVVDMMSATCSAANETYMLRRSEVAPTPVVGIAMSIGRVWTASAIFGDSDSTLAAAFSRLAGLIAGANGRMLATAKSTFVNGLSFKRSDASAGDAPPKRRTPA